MSLFNPVSQTCIRIYREVVEKNERTLQSVAQSIQTASLTNRVRRVKHILETCEADAKKIMEFLNTQVAPVLTESARDSSEREYVPDINVPPNPPRLTLDYNSAKTCEGQLKTSVMEEDGSRVVGVVAWGQGGVGKTCALRGFVEDKDIKKRFPGGLLYIQLGNDATISTVIQGIAAIVRRTGNPLLALKVEGSKTLQEAAYEASIWFRPHTCLFLIDDIWFAHDIDSNVLGVLGTLVNERSRLIYTTRSQQFISGCQKVIEFSAKEKHGKNARMMLMTHAGFTHEETLSERNEEAVRGILEMCGGLPIAIGVVGETVRKESRGRTDGIADAWSHVHDRIIAKAEYLVDHDIDPYGSMQMIVDNSLDVLQSEHEEMSIDKLFCALCILQKQQRVPVHTLQHLWGVNNLAKTIEIVEKFEDVCIARKVYNGSQMFIQLHDVILDIAIWKASKKYEVRTFWRTLIDNYIAQESKHNEETSVGKSSQDYAKASDSRKRKPIVQMGRKLRRLCPYKRTDGRNYLQEKFVKDQIGTESTMWEWWKTESDGYIHDNVCRALREAGDAEQLLWLVSKPQWIVSRLQESGILAVEQDLEVAKTTAGEGKDERLCTHLEILGKAARMGCTYVAENKREAWFQLHGRLLWYATQCKRTKRFVEEIEECAPKPWAKASPGFLHQARTGAADVLVCDGEPNRLLIDEENVAFVCVQEEDPGSVKLNLTRYNIASGEIEVRACDTGKEGPPSLSLLSPCGLSQDLKKVARLFHDGSVMVWYTGSNERRLFGSKCQWYGPGLEQDPITCVDLSYDGTRIVGGSRQGTLRVWEADSGKAIGVPLVGHTKCVHLVAWSADGKRVVSTSYDKSVRVWDVESGQPVTDAMTGHTGNVGAVAWSADGRRVVSGSDDKTARVWDVKCGALVGNPLVGHRRRVICVALSGDGRRVVSGSSDCTVRVWEVGGSPEGRLLYAHTFDLRCVAVSPSGRRVVSASEDQTVRVLELSSGPSVEDTSVREYVKVCSIVWSEGFRRVACGFYDGSVHIWEVESGDRVGQPLIGHKGPVSAVAFSADGGQVLSGSFDMTVRVWESESGKVLSGPFYGHTGHVGDLAMSADGRRVVSRCTDHTICVWEVASGRAIAPPLLRRMPIGTVAINRDGSRVLFYELGGLGWVWDVTTNKLVEIPVHEEWSVSKSASFNLCATQKLIHGSDNEAVFGTCEKLAVCMGDWWLSPSGHSCRLQR